MIEGKPGLGKMFRAAFSHDMRNTFWTRDVLNS